MGSTGLPCVLTLRAACSLLPAVLPQVPEGGCKGAAASVIAWQLEPSPGLADSSPAAAGGEPPLA